MTALLNERKQSVSYLETIQRAAELQQGQFDYLVIAHDDPVMQKRLSQVMSSETSATVNLHQSDWDLASAEFLAALDWSIDVGGTKHLVLVGHSEAVLPASSADKPFGTGSGLLDDLEQIQLPTRQSQQQYSERIDALIAEDRIRQAVSNNRLQVHTLFYLAHSRSFKRYSIADREYRPLS